MTHTAETPRIATCFGATSAPRLPHQRLLNGTLVFKLYLRRSSVPKPKVYMRLVVDIDPYSFL
jgi:hypothetical protein